MLVRGMSRPVAEVVGDVPGSASPRSGPQPQSADRRALSSLFLGHFAVDFAQGAVPALIVFFQARFGLSYMGAGAIVLAATASSSLTQPLFGSWSDRRASLWLLPAGVAIAGVGLGLSTLMPGYAALLACIFVSAIGVGAYHPEAAKYAGFASRGRPASSISIFSLGGNVGLAAGPIAASGLVLAFGLEAGVLLALPCLAIAWRLQRERPYLATFAPAPGDRRATVAANQPRALWILLTVVALRSVAFYGLFTFVPLWEVAEGRSAGQGALLLSLLLVAGALGTITAGPIADRRGGKPVLWITMAATGPLIGAYVLLGGVVGWVAIVLAGAMTVGTLGITTALAQQYMPGNIGMASGLSMGFSIGLGGVAAFLLGAFADAVDLRAAFLVTMAAVAAGALLALALPRATRAP
jgi:MFS transporter, FSR family, fosmidomycin resistance protein